MRSMTGCAIIDTGKPLLGICGGHQLVSTQLEDGFLEGRIGGTLAGTYEIELTQFGRCHPQGLSSSPRFNFANYLHVVPSEAQQARVLAHIGKAELSVSITETIGTQLSSILNPSEPFGLVCINILNQSTLGTIRMIKKALV